MRSFVLSIFIMFFSNTVFAATPVCKSASGGYCQYIGKVKTIYINAENQILIYFDTPIAVSDTEVAGITITKGNAAAFDVTTNPDFAKMAYSTALAAQASGRDIIIQMRGSFNGYLQFDRVSLNSL